MSKLKIGYFADGPWSHNAFKLIINNSDIDVRFIVPRNDTEDSTLKELASQYNIDYITDVHVNSDAFYAKAQTYECEVFVSMSYNQIFRKRILDCTPMGIINCHAGKLPFYRGRNILNWALINDEKEFGITVHFVDEGIDTGDIILQRSYPISDSDSYKTLLERAHDDCAEILSDALKQMCIGQQKRIVQKEIHPAGFYCGIRGEGDEIIDWNSSSRDIFNFIRSICSPGPKARTYLKGNLVTINASREIDQAPTYKSTAGQLISKTSEGFLVKTGDSYIEILEYEVDGKIRVGDKLTSLIKS
ncbi:MAG: methionyl-tRNA formyltransferase [Saprospiraceae bacterium]|jgi:methionyl-tRNA formyltransferase